MVFGLFISFSFGAFFDDPDFASPPLDRYRYGAAAYRTAVESPDAGSPDPQIEKIASDIRRRAEIAKAERDIEQKELIAQLVDARRQKESFDNCRRIAEDKLSALVLQSKEQIAIYERISQELEDARRQRDNTDSDKRLAEEKLLCALVAQRQAEEDLKLMQQDFDNKSKEFDSTIRVLEQQINKKDKSLDRHKKRNDELLKKLEKSKTGFLTHGAITELSIQRYLDDIARFVSDIKELIASYEDAGLKCDPLRVLIDSLVKDSAFFQLSEEMKSRFYSGDEEVTKAFLEKKNLIKERVDRIMGEMEKKDKEKKEKMEEENLDV